MPSYCPQARGAPTLARLGDEERGSGPTSIAPDLVLSSSSERHLRFRGLQGLHDTSCLVLMTPVDRAVFFQPIGGAIPSL